LHSNRVANTTTTHCPLTFISLNHTRAVLELVDVWVARVDKRLCNVVVRAPHRDLRV